MTMATMADTRTPIQKVLAVARGVEARSDNDFMCQCPAHDDGRPSLHVSVDASGKLLLYCFAGCKTALICYGFGLTVAELFPDNHGSKTKSQPDELEATYDYRAVDGTLLYQALRKRKANGGKTFTQRRPDGDGGWIYNLKGVDRVLYRLPELVAARADLSQYIYLAEGEKKVEALRKWGLIATCNVGGAGKWLASYNPYFHNARVIILPDNDPPGRGHAERIASSLKGIAKLIKIVDLPGLPPKGDIVDWQAAGHTQEELDAVIETAPAYVPPDSSSPVTTAKTEAQDSDKEAGWLDDPENWTDIGNGRLFAETFGESVRYCNAWNQWLVWNGLRWVPDESGSVYQYAKQVADKLWEIAYQIEDEGEAIKAFKFAKASSSQRAILAMLDMAKSEPGIPIAPSEMDSDPWLLNCMNGTLDLTTGTLRPHDREDLITKLCPTKYDPDAECPLWLQTLSSIFKDNAEVIWCLQSYLGYCLTGDVREQCLVILYGGGANGKSTLLNVIMTMLGESYSMKAVTDLLMSKKHEAHPTERADLHGKRFVACVETGEDKCFDEVMVKELTGGDPIRARRMRENHWQFMPTHKLALCTNHRPRVRGTDHAIWRRLMLIPFDVKFWDPAKGETGPEELKRDSTLTNRLLLELPGILHWCVMGCLEWQEKGLYVPAEVRAATGNYKQSEDVIQRFLDDCCIVNPSVKVAAAVILKEYSEWADANKEPKLSSKAIGQRLKARGFESKKNRKGVMEYHGIGIVETVKSDPQTPSDGKQMSLLEDTDDGG